MTRRSRAPDRRPTAGSVFVAQRWVARAPRRPAFRDVGERRAQIRSDELFDEQRGDERPAFQDGEVQLPGHQQGDDDGGTAEFRKPDREADRAAGSDGPVAQPGANFGDQPRRRARSDVPDDERPGVEEDRQRDEERDGEERKRARGDRGLRSAAGRRSLRFVGPGCDLAERGGFEDLEAERGALHARRADPDPHVLEHAFLGQPSHVLEFLTPDRLE